MEKAVQKEIEAAAKNGKVLMYQGSKYYLIQVTTDGAWPKRPSSKTGGHSSSTGFVSVIGTETGLVIGAKMKSLYCRICMPFIQNGKVQKDHPDFPTDHECTRNWEGPPGGMEPALTVEIFQELFEKYNIIVDEMVQDGDSSTMSLLTEIDLYREMGVLTTKIDCWLHSTRCFGNKMIAISARCATLKKISFPQKSKNCVRSAICHWNDIYLQDLDLEFAAKGLELDLRNVPNHVLGDHTNCGTWCGKTTTQTVIVEKKFMDEINVALGRLISASKNLVKKKSTNNNESFNNVVAVTNGNKFFHYGNSLSCVMR